MTYGIGDIRSLLGNVKPSEDDRLKVLGAKKLFASTEDVLSQVEPLPAKEPSNAAQVIASPSKPSGEASDTKGKRFPTQDEKLHKDKCTLFVGNIPALIEKRKFEAPFKQFGKIVSSRFRSVPIKDKYKKANKKFGVMKKDFVDKDTEKLSQNGYIVFQEEASVRKAIEAKIHGTDLFQSGHFIRLDYVIRSSGDEKKSSETTGAINKFDRKKSIHIPHLPATVSDVEVRKIVESSHDSLKGTVRGVRVVRTAKSGTFAFVLLSERCHATTAIKQNSDGIDYSFGTQTLKIKFQRIMKDEDLTKDKEAKLKEASEKAKIASKKSLSRIKWQARLTRKGNPKVVSHHALPRKERQAKMQGAALRISRKNIRK